MKSFSSQSKVLKNNKTDRIKQQDAIAPIVASPKGISTKTSPQKPLDTLNDRSGINDLGKARRRLSVVSDNELIDGMTLVSTEDISKSSGNTTGRSIAVTSYAGISKKGYAPYNPRKKNQDSLIMASHNDTNSLLLCVFDGHGEVGDSVSQFFKTHLSTRLFNHKSFLIKNSIDSIKEAIGDSIKTLEKELINDVSVDTEFSGTTAVICVIRENTLIAANIGDSRISRGYRNKDGKIIGEAISSDHKPDRIDEKERILRMGGRVFAVEYDDGIDGPPRVWLAHMDVPGLAMSRSLGDTIAHTAGVISEPEYYVRNLDTNDKYIVIATDGLWEFMKDHEVIEVANNNGDDVKKAVDSLIVLANARWMKAEQVVDDTTVVVARIEVK